MIRALGRGAVMAARGMWDFLVGDTPEVLLIVAVVVGMAYVAAGHGAVGVTALPLIAVGGLALSVWRACRSPQ